MATTSNPKNKPGTFTDVREAVAVAAYVEQMFAAEQQWTMNRLSWLFISQSFLITAFVLLISSGSTAPAAYLLLFGLSLLGFVCCVAVGLAIIAAAYEVNSLGDERARLACYINNNSPANLPLIGASEGLRDRTWTL